MSPKCSALSQYDHDMADSMIGVVFGFDEFVHLQIYMQVKVKYILNIDNVYFITY